MNEVGSKAFSSGLPWRQFITAKIFFIYLDNKRKFPGARPNQSGTVRIILFSRTYLLMRQIDSKSRRSRQTEQGGFRIPMADSAGPRYPGRI